MARTKGPTHKLSGVQLNEISLVGAGDNPEAHVLLLKIKADDGKNAVTSFSKAYKGGKQDAALKKWFDGAGAILKDAMTFQQIIDNQEIKSKVWTLVYTLEDSISSIMNDSDVTDKASMIQQSVDEFKAAITPIAKGGVEMPAELKKQLEATEAKVLKLEGEKTALETEVASLKAAPKVGEKCPTCGATSTKKSDDIDKSQLSEAVLKRLDAQDAEIEKNRKENEVLKEAELSREYIAKGVEVAAVGAGDEIGTLLKSIAKLDSTLAGKVFDVLKSADAKIRTGGLFIEIGKESGTEGAKAYDKIVAKAAELRKTCPELSDAQAFTKVYDTDHELRKQHIAETRG
jgi:hypothetical protein